MISPADGSTVSGATVLVQIDASDADAGPSALTVTWRVDGGAANATQFNDETGYYEAVWDSQVQSDGPVTLTALADDGQDVSQDSITVTVDNVADPEPDPDPSGTVHISDIDVSFSSTTGQNGNGRWIVGLTFGVQDQEYQPVSNATVTGTWSYNGASQSCTTDSGGSCSIQSEGAIKTDTISFSVTGIQHQGSSYAPEDNEDPDGDSDGTTIEVVKNIQ
jgi:hypothetical protein